MSATAKWVIGILITVAMASSGYVMGRVDRVDADLQNYKMSAARDAVSLAKEQVVISGQIAREYVLKEDYKCDIEGVRKQLAKMDDKLDRLIGEVRRTQ